MTKATGAGKGLNHFTAYVFQKENEGWTLSSSVEAGTEAAAEEECCLLAQGGTAHRAEPSPINH